MMVPMTKQPSDKLMVPLTREQADLLHDLVEKEVIKHPTGGYTREAALLEQISSTLGNVRARG